MQRDEIITRLNWFYSLEIHQVDLYTAQAHSVEDIYLAKTLARVATIEQQHVDNMAAEIERLGGTPTKLGDALAPYAGKLVGGVTGAMGAKTILKANILLEQKAMHDYKDFILSCGDQDLLEVLWNNLIDEDLHTAWFANKLAELKGRD